MLTHRRLFLSLALSALVGLIATSGARAESISMTITGGGGAILVDTFILSSATSQFYGNVDIASLNAALVTHGYAYQFSALGGGSDWAGTLAQGTMNVSGGLSIIPGVGGTHTDMTITETEGGFTDPHSLGMGTLMSSSTGNFTNQVAGAGHTASSAFNATSTPTYTVFATTAGGAPGPDPEGGVGFAMVGPPVPTLYTLTNVITFGLTPNAGATVTDSFGVTATISVPEPATLVTMLMGIPLPLVVLGLLRRRRLARA